MFGVPPAPNRPQARFKFAAPFESAENVIPPTSAVGLTSVPLALKVNVPFELADATGSAITLPAVAVAPVIVKTPPVLSTVTPVIPAPKFASQAPPHSPSAGLRCPLPYRRLPSAR